MDKGTRTGTDTQRANQLPRQPTAAIRKEPKTSMPKARVAVDQQPAQPVTLFADHGRPETPSTSDKGSIMNHSVSAKAGQLIGTLQGRQVVGLDIAKDIFQIHTVQMHSGEIVNKSLKRARLLEHFAQMPPCLVGIEACGGAHHWARHLLAQGHSVRLIDPAKARAFATGNKTDAIDAAAIWLAVQQPGMRFVGIKTQAQQATLVLHRQRQLLMKMRTMQTNALRGMLHEFGVTFPQGKRALTAQIAQGLQALEPSVPQPVLESLRQQWQRVQEMDADIHAIEERLSALLRQDVQMQRVLAIPGVGLLTATAVVATMGEAAVFKSGRHFCAWLGLVPKQHGSGGKVRLGGISKRGDRYVRTLLVGGARSVMHHLKDEQSWLGQLKARKHANVAVVAQAAKTARTIWALVAKEQAYQAGHQSVRPVMA